ncbi:hypothetical protein G7Y89_g13032 [Cudoniella acicularis]|uniref:Uncharacterized protein n=1 Tax=Cudoniella acicularis TaxID=354080 RepID=A0A8H4VWG0_9HELO|nr:hypothetical protein G7Y89_g13032 [Cudoniella acicularis]
MLCCVVKENRSGALVRHYMIELFWITNSELKRDDYTAAIPKDRRFLLTKCFDDGDDVAALLNYVHLFLDYISDDADVGLATIEGSDGKVKDEILEIPLECTPYLNARFFVTQLTNFKHSQNDPRRTKYELDRFTLSRHARGKTTSRGEAYSEHH